MASDPKGGLLVRIAAKAAAFLPFLAPNSRVLTEEPTSGPTWPDLVGIGAVCGRPATTEDVKRGHAAVLINPVDGVSAGTPLDLVIPQYAWHVDGDDGTRTPAVVIQAEHAEGYTVAGFLNLSTGELVVSLVQELELLGTDMPT